MINILSKTPLFAELTGEDLTLLSSHARQRKYPKNTIIVNQGDISDSLYIISKGKVSVYLDDSNGKEVLLNTLVDGDSFGELAPLAQIPRVANIKTMKETHLITITKTALLECISNNPNMSMKIINLLVERIRDLTEEVNSFALLDVYGRVIRILEKFSKIEGSQKVVNDLSQQEIAKRVGASREMVNRIFKELKAGEYISLNGSQVVIEKKLPSGW